MTSTDKALLASLTSARDALNKAIDALKPPIKLSPIPKPAPKYKGLSGIIRKALREANFPTDLQIYNSLQKDGTRRIKIYTNGVFECAPSAKLAILDYYLLQLLGKRYVTSRLHSNEPWVGGSSYVVIVRP